MFRPPLRALWRRELGRAAAAKPSVRVLLDVGMGHGRFGPLLQEVYPLAQLLGVDHDYPFVRRAARVAPGIYHAGLVSDALRLPLRGAVVDFVFASMIMHHVPARGSLLNEIVRVLAPQGMLAIRQATKETLPTNEMLRFFSPAYEAEYRRMPGRGEMLDLLRASGLVRVERRTISQQVFDSYEDYQQLAARKPFAVMGTMTAQEFQARLTEYSAFCSRKQPHRPPPENVDLFTASKE